MIHTFENFIREFNSRVLRRRINGATAIVTLFIVFSIALVVILLAYGALNTGAFDIQTYFPHLPFPRLATSPSDIKQFISEEEFRNYLEKGVSEPSYMTIDSARNLALPAPALETAKGGAGEPTRVSETNVQVIGIDEPDILKTDGKEIYFSPGYEWIWRGPMVFEQRESLMMPPYMKSQIELAKVFPPEELSLDTKIDDRGDLLLSKNTLVVFSGQKISGYNVSDPKSTSKKWTLNLEGDNYVAGARLYQDKIYLITASLIDSYHPCPIIPLREGENPVEIKCTEIYYPVQPVYVDSTFVSMIVDPASGKIEKKVSFVGSSSSSIVYVSQNSIYVTYQYQESIVKFFYNFLKEKASDLLSKDAMQKIKKLEGYDISEQAKLTELQLILQKFENTLSEDESMKIQNELNNRMTDYYKEHKRELERTGIVKIGLENLDIKASGNVPGHPLNQFSLDEYEGNLRIAITVGDTWSWMITGASGESANDVYVLDSSLKIKGEVKDLGLSERIYSARFIEDKGYLVTFRQTDPFYVLDLRNPENPQLKGELKIPGYSSYLHPISKDKILGIGEAQNQVKISLFDVSSPENPVEKDKYNLDEYWSEVSSTHHAFLMDGKHEIFFLPGSKGGYIFSYKNDELKLEKTVSKISARRAIYINDYLYVIGDDMMVVLNEQDWSKVNSIEF